jgi:polycystin 2
MFLAILNDTYMEVKADLKNKKNTFDISDFVKQGYIKLRERLTAKHDRITDIRRALSVADINCDKRLDFEEWRNEMKSRGYSEEEIETMFAKYDINGDRVLDENEQRALSSDLSKQTDAILQEMDELNMTVKNMPVKNIAKNEYEGNVATSRQEVSIEDYNDLAKRVDSMETCVGSVLTKV